MQHIDEGTIHAWLDGALSGDEQMLIEEHVRQCAECATAVAEARGLIAGSARIVSALDDVPRVTPPKSVQTPPRTPRSVWRSLGLTPLRAGIAALLMVAVASVFTARHDRAEKLALAPRVPSAVTIAGPDNEAPSAAASQSPAAQPSPPPSTKVASKPAPPAKRVSVDSKAIPPASAPPGTQKAGSEERAQTVDTTPDSKTANQAVTRKLAEAMNDFAAAQRSAAPTAARMYTNLRPTSALDGSGRVVLTCYQVLRDSLNPRSIMPDRFALERREPLHATSNLVRAVDSTGRIDGVITSASWQSVGDETVLVTWNSTDPRQVLQLTRTNDGVEAAATVDGVQLPVHVLATRCHF
jgi:Predicted transmembrane transcriptional regulator (anti-sigma factor)